jgi:hypothetical protein
VLDLLQFHWWDYGAAGPMMDAMRHLNDLRKEGLIRGLALTNFDTAHVKAFLDAGIPIASNQVRCGRSGAAVGVAAVGLQRVWPLWGCSGCGRCGAALGVAALGLQWVWPLWGCTGCGQPPDTSAWRVAALPAVMATPPPHKPDGLLLCPASSAR